MRVRHQALPSAPGTRARLHSSPSIFCACLRPSASRDRRRRADRHYRPRRFSLPCQRLANPPFSTPDDVHARALMCSIWERTQNDRDAARDEAVVAAREWLSEGRSTVSRAWLQPIIATENEVGVITAIQSRFDVDLESLEEVYRDPRLRKQLLKPMKVRRAWGLPGLMWALLLDRLEAGQSQRACERCGRLIQGRSNKDYCGKDDNEECYRARKREDRRRSRRSR